jgi:hypothetical protein
LTGTGTPNPVFPNLVNFPAAARKMAFI